MQPKSNIAIFGEKKSPPRIRNTVIGSCALDPAWGGVVSLIGNSKPISTTHSIRSLSLFFVENSTMRASRDMQPLGTGLILAD